MIDVHERLIRTNGLLTPESRYIHPKPTHNLKPTLCITIDEHLETPNVLQWYTTLDFGFGYPYFTIVARAV